MANSFWDDEEVPQTKSGAQSFWDTEDAAASQQAEPQEAPANYEMPGLGRRLYEQNVVIPVRAARHLAPFPETLQEYVIDPIAGAISGETSEQHKKKREEYDRYLRQMYPTATEAYESRGQMAGGLIKAGIPIVGSGEGITEQAATRPESIGFNVETGLNLLPPILSAPRAAAKGVGFIKARPDQRQSLKSYSENPSYYDEYEARAGGKPVRALEEEVQNNLASRESAMSKNITDLTGEVSELKTQDAMQVARAIDDIKTKTELGTYDGDAMISARNKLQEEYKKTAEIRNKVLEETQGEMDISPLLDLVDNAENSVILPEHKANIRAVAADIEAMSQFRGQGDNTFQSISPRQLNELRAKLQNNVSWGGHSQPWETQYKALARQFNDILDASIPGNNPLRAKIREETLRYNTAEDLFGGDYPLRKFQSAAKDPMKRRALENLAIPEIHDILKTIDYRENFQKNLKFGEKPKSDVVEEYLRKKAMLEQAKAEKLPLTSREAPSALETAMMETYRNPKLNATNKISQYARDIHPEGQMDFMQKLDATKVLRDVEGLNGAQGSRMVNLGRYLGGAVGTGIGAMTGNPAWSVAGGGFGALAGGVLDNNASNIFRGGMRYGEKMAPAMSTAKLGSRMYSDFEQNKQYSGIPMDRLAGTKYEQQIMQTLQEDPKKAAVIHYVMSQNDPEYAALVTGEDQKKKIELPRYGGLGADIGNMIDNVTWSDKVGLDPQEQEQSGFQYGSLPSMGMAPFKKINKKFNMDFKKPDWFLRENDNIHLFQNDFDKNYVKQLAESIKKNGWDGPAILMHEGKAINGTHRIRALRELYKENPDIDLDIPVINVYDYVNDYLNKTGQKSIDYRSLRNVFEGTELEQEVKKNINDW